jgi:hypothetical protein
MPKLIIEIDRSGSIFCLLNALIGAYNRRTDVMARANATDPAEITALNARLKTSTDELDAAVKAAQSKGE